MIKLKSYYNKQMLEKFNLYYQHGNDVFLLKSLKGFNRLIKLELKEELDEFNSLEEFEKILEKLNKKFNKKNISFFLIDKNDDK